MRVLLRCATAVLAAAATLAGVAVTAQAADTVVTVTDGGAPGWVRFDSAGNAIDAHDGEIDQFSYVGKTKVAPKYYLYGTGYSCGYVRFHGYNGDPRPATPFCGFTVYESTDLRHWKSDGKLFNPNTTSPTNWQSICNSATLSCYRPHMLYDYAAGRYVLWVNTYDVDANNVQHGYHVLTSTSPKGPFTELTDGTGKAALPNLKYPTGGDFDLFQDNDRAHTGYIAYTVRYDSLHPTGGFDYRIVVEKLSRDYLTGTGAATNVATRHTEAPSMFKRGSDYYLTMADPYCAYCAGTGTTFMRAHTPLGSWHGPSGYAAASLGAMLLEGRGGLYVGRDSSDATQQTLANLQDYDLTFRVRPQPDYTGSTTHYARAGWMFRAQDLANGYLWLLSSKPRGTAPATLYKETIVNGAITSNVAVSVPVPFTPYRWATVRTHVVGSTIQTYLNNVLIDTTTDSTFTKGYTGLRERTNDAAWYDDVLLQSPAGTATPQTTYLGENFDDGSLAAFGALDTYRRHGYKISVDSCGGQPDDVAMLSAPATSDNPGGSQYLYQSDRWDYGDQNEAQATQYWEPLRFDSAGNIQPLTCASVYTMVLNAATASRSPVGGFDRTLDGYGVVQDIAPGHVRGQSFLVTKATTLTAAKVTVFQTDGAAGNAPDAPLTVSVYDLDPSGRPTTMLAQGTVAESRVPWTPRVVTVPMKASLAPNSNGSAHRYAILLSTTASTGLYGTVRNDATAFDAVPGGAGLVGTANSDGSVQWTAEPRRDIRAVPVTG